MTTTNPENFTLDAASNITARTGPAATYTIDGENRPTSDGTSTLVWSDADRLTARGSDTFGYDALDRLVSSTVAGTTRSYAYSGDGLLQSRTQGSVTSLLWDPATAIARLLQSGGDRIVYGLGPLYITRADGTTRVLARDGQKSVRAEVDGTGSVTGSWRYRAYGETAQSSGQSTPSILGYAGQLLDPSALYYLRARWYDTASGRFTARDALAAFASAPASLNSFGYAGANPIVMADPSGLVASSGDDVGICEEDGCVADGDSLKQEGQVGCWDLLGCDPIDDRKTLADLLAGRRVTPVWTANSYSFFVPEGSIEDATSVGGGSGGGPGGALGELLRQLREYGQRGAKILENGRIRFYGETTPARMSGEMSGRRLVREWDPASGAKRTWFETLDSSGRVRIVRPETGGQKVHFIFDQLGNYVGKR